MEDPAEIRKSTGWETPQEGVGEDANDSRDCDVSLAPARDHVFLTWHDIEFIVPRAKTKKSKHQVESAADQRADLL